MNQHKNEILDKKWRFIINPVAGGGSVSRLWPKIEAQLRSAGADFEVVFTEGKFHAAMLAEEAIASGCRHLVAVGGDGTAHEVVNGIMRQTTCPSTEITFTSLPIGTGNDWVKTHRIPKDCQKWVSYFNNATTTLQDVGWLAYQENGIADKRFFFNVAGMSYDAYVAKRSAAYKKQVSSTIFYLYFILRCLSEFRLPRHRVHFNGTKVEKALYSINIGICRYSGGGLQLVPQALPDDGKLALTLVGHLSKLMVLLVTPFFYLGKIGWLPKVSLFQTEEILVESADQHPIMVEADGEFLGEGPVRFGILPKALKILVP